MRTQKAGCILLDLDTNNVALVYRKKLNDYSFPKGHLEKVELYFYLALDAGKSNKKIPIKDQEELVWKPFDEVEKILSYDDLKEFWNDYKTKINENISNLKIINGLFGLQDLKYKGFTSKLIPNISSYNIIGVKTALIRKYAKSISFMDAIKFLDFLPHKYQEEYILHSCLMNIYIKDIDLYLKYLIKFLPYIDNWVTCDVINPKIFKKYPQKVYLFLEKLLNSKKTYTKRFAIVSFLQFYLDDNFNEDINKLMISVKSEEYYIKMALAWYFSFALIKQYNKTINIFENKVLDKWIHNKSIQKALESYRITKSTKEYLKTLKIK